MELLTTSEMAKKWDISRRRVTTLCAEGRIEGAILKGNTWLIPENAEKPDDPRRVRKIEQEKC
ncbi:helix-turn-helix domain-containing protein [Coprococcus comes]|uniref:helix-turn-helix domain-containing protein n=1 Tax=Coprococcus comes TaxID=410072 RepID=UPI0032BF2CBB